MLNFTIRPALTSDIDDILSLTSEGIDIWGNHIKPNLKPWLDEISCPSYVQDKLADPHHHIFMAELENQVVGTVYLNTSDGNIAHMGGLYCSLRKSGLGTILLNHVIQESIIRGYTAMDCDIYENNVASISLMEKYGAKHYATAQYGGVNYLNYVFDFANFPVYAA
jgi:ribosomal protein S18 acetylase RimI-like enzyme